MTLTTTPTASKLWVAITPTTKPTRPGKEQTTRHDGTTTPDAADIDACRKLRVVLVERALDLV